MILAGDIGGTNTRLATFPDAMRFEPTNERTFPSRGHSGLEEIVATYVADAGIRPELACFGCAGPVRDGRCVATNLPWIVDQTALSRLLGARAWVINDLEANAYGIPTVTANKLVVLRAGASDAVGNAALISAGTGLGEAGLYWDGSMHAPFACEGGHGSFAPDDDLEIDLLRYLAQRFGHVSWERVVSGPGLVNVYEFLRDTKHGEEPAWLTDALRTGDRAAVISKAASDGKSPLCAQALDLFVALYGAEAGNLALKLMATGGVYIGGGIAPRIVDRLQTGDFLARFTNKGRMKPLLEAMPVRVILDDLTALRGSARCAALRGGALPR